MSLESVTHRGARAVTAPARRGEAPRLSAADTLGVLAEVVMPLVAKGIIARRPRVVGLEERLDADGRALRRLSRLRRRYGRGPVLLRLPGRDVALLLAPEDAHRALREPPGVIAPANREKRSALSHFQPRGVLISDGRERAARRELNEAALDTARPVHRLADGIVMRVRDQAGALRERVAGSGELGWDEFTLDWWRMVRRVVLGDSARDDHALTDSLARLRRDANWAFLGPRRRRLRGSFLEGLDTRLAGAEENSLAGLVRSLPGAPLTAPADQVAHWLFAFDAAAMASFRALALLDAHPAWAHRIRDDLGSRDLAGPQELPLLRASVLESLRLWPTTPAVLRDTRVETSWESGTLPAGSAIVIHVPFLHRDGERVPEADAFAPEIWLGEHDAPGDWPFIPFSEGPAVCPGRNLVLLITSTLLAALLERHEFGQVHARPLRGDRPLPAELSPFRLRYALRATPSSS